MSEPPAIHYSPPSPGATGGRSNNSLPLTQIGDGREMRSATASFSLPVQSDNSMCGAAKYGCGPSVRLIHTGLFKLPNYPRASGEVTHTGPGPRRARGSRSHYDKVEMEFPPARQQQLHQRGGSDVVKGAQGVDTRRGRENDQRGRMAQTHRVHLI